MEQDFTTINIGNSSLRNKNQAKIIVPKNKTDQRAIKIENETENFKIIKIPSLLSNEITQCRVNSKKTQSDMAKLLMKPLSMYQELENRKAIYNPATKALIQSIERKLTVKFKNK